MCFDENIAMFKFQIFLFVTIYSFTENVLLNLNLVNAMDNCINSKYVHELIAVIGQH